MGRERVRTQLGEIGLGAEGPFSYSISALLPPPLREGHCHGKTQMREDSLGRLYLLILLSSLLIAVECITEYTYTYHRQGERVWKDGAAVMEFHLIYHF